MDKLKPHLPLLVILALALLVRLYRFDYPLMDWHSFRQADTVSVTQEFINHSYPVWQPHYHDLGNIQSGEFNLEGYRMVEFPIVNYALAQIAKLSPNLDLVAFSRFASALVSTVGVYLLFVLITSWSGKKTLGLLSTAVMAFLPYGIYFGRTILPEPYQVTMILLSLVAFTKYLHRPKFCWWAATLISLVLALLIKPTSAFIAPLLVVMAWQKDRWRALARWQLWLLAIFATIPLLWWRQYLLGFPTGIPKSDWLFNSNGIRWRPAWWRWLFYHRLTQEWLGYTGLFFFIAGWLPEKLSLKLKQRFALTNFDWRLLAWGAGMFAYLSVFATGNVQHDYYQYLLLPLVCVIVARGIYLLFAWWQQETSSAITKEKIFPTLQASLALFTGGKLTKHRLFRGLAGLPVVVLLAISLWVTVPATMGKFNVNNWQQVHLGAQAKALLPADAIVIADTVDGDTNFLWQTGHRGFSTLIDLERKIELGAAYLIRVNRDDLYHLYRQQFQLVYEDGSGYIFDLTSPLASPSTIINHENQE